MKIIKSVFCLSLPILFSLVMSACVPPMNYVKGDVPAYNVLDYYTGSFEMYDPNLIDPYCDDTIPYPMGCHQGVSYYFDPPIFIDDYMGHDYFTIDQNVLLYENGILKTPTSSYIDQEIWNSINDALYTNTIHNKLTLKFSADYLNHLQTNPGLDIEVVVYNYFSHAEDGDGNPILGFAAPGTAPIRFMAWPEDSFALSSSHYPPHVLRHTPPSITPRFPPHGRIKIDFSEAVNGFVYVDKPKPIDLRITDAGGLPIENQPLPTSVRATTVEGWEINTEYNVLLPSEYEKLFYDMADPTMNPKNLIYPDLYSLRGHALQDISGAPLYTTGTGTIDQDDEEPSGIYYEHYPLPAPPTGAEARMPFNLRFTTARVKITSPQYLGRYTDIPNTITGVCTLDVSQVHITGLDDGTPIDVTTGCIAGEFSYSSVSEPSSEDFFELRATVSGTTDDFDVIGVSKVSLSDQPVVSVTPYAFNNTGAGTVTITVTGWPGASVCLYFDTDPTCHSYVITPDGTLTVTIPIEEFSTLTEGLHYITVVQYDTANNPSYVSERGNFFIDNVKPALTFNHPTTDENVSSYVFIDIEINDPSPSSFVNSGTLVMYLDDPSKTTPLDTSDFLVTPFSIIGAIDDVIDGTEHILDAQVCDNAGNCSDLASVSFDVDYPTDRIGIDCPLSSTSVGDTITLAGAGFDPSAVENNAIIFHNSIWIFPSTVTSSTSMTVVVPEGATTGPLRVGRGHYLSNSCTLTIVPSITGVLPQIVRRGENIVVTGTGFSSVATENEVRFCTSTSNCNGTSNYFAVTPSWSSPSTLQVNVPTSSAQALSGPIFIEVNGALSGGISVLIATPPDEITENLFGNPTSTVISMGQTAMGSISVLGQYDVYTFYATAGTYIDVDLWSVDNYNQMYGSIAPYIEIYDPNLIFLNYNAGSSSTGFLYVLPYTGTYTIAVADYYDTHTGFYNLTIQSVPSTTPSIIQVSATVGMPGETITIDGNNFDSGTTVSIGGISAQVLSYSTTQLEIEVPLYNGNDCPTLGGYDGSWGYLTASNGVAVSNEVPFTWQCDAGSFTRRERDYGPATISPGETAIGRLAPQYLDYDTDYYSFQADAGDAVSLDLQSIYPSTGEVISSGGTPDLYIRIYSPDGTLITSNNDGTGTKNSHLGRIVLTKTGTFTIQVTSYVNGNDHNGMYKLSLNSDTPSSYVPIIFRMVSGNHQSTNINYGLPSPLVMEVTDDSSTPNPVQGVRIYSYINGYIYTTGSDGRFSFYINNIGSVAGHKQYAFRVAGMSNTQSKVNIPSDPIVFEAWAHKGNAVLTGTPVAAIMFGDGQIAKVNQALDDQVCVYVYDQSTLLPISNHEVNWSIDSGGNVNPPVSVSSGGQACTTVTLSKCTNTSCQESQGATYSDYINNSQPWPTMIGVNVVHADAGSAGTLYFYEYGIPIEPDHITVSPSLQYSGIEGVNLRNPISASVEDAYDNPISNTELTFKIRDFETPGGQPGGILPVDYENPNLDYMPLLGDSDILDSYTAVADSNGFAEIYWILGNDYNETPRTQVLDVSASDGVVTSSTLAAGIIDPAIDDDEVAHYITFTTTYTTGTYGGLINKELDGPISVFAYEVNVSDTDYVYTRSQNVEVDATTSNIDVSASGSMITDSNGFLPLAGTMGEDVGAASLEINGTWADASTADRWAEGEIAAHKATQFKIVNGVSEQYIRSTLSPVSFNSVTFKLSDESGHGVPNVEIGLIGVPRGPLRVTPQSSSKDSEIGETDNDGEITFDFDNNASSGASFLQFAPMDESIRNSLETITDDLDRTQDSNLVRYLNLETLPLVGSRLSSKYGNNVLRLRLVRLYYPLTPSPLKIYITFSDEVKTLITARGLNENDIWQSLQSEMLSKLNTIGITAPIIEKDPSSKENTRNYIYFDIVKSLHQNGTTYPLLGRHYGTINWENYRPHGSTLIEVQFEYWMFLVQVPGVNPNTYIGKALAQVCLHEFGHSVGLVDRLNLLGTADPNELDEDHDDPFLYELTGNLSDCNVMDTFCSDSSHFTGNREFRLMNQMYLMNILP